MDWIYSSKADFNSTSPEHTSPMLWSNYLSSVIICISPWLPSYRTATSETTQYTTALHIMLRSILLHSIQQTRSKNTRVIISTLASIPTYTTTNNSQKPTLPPPKTHHNPNQTCIQDCPHLLPPPLPPFITTNASPPISDLASRTPTPLCAGHPTITSSVPHHQSPQNLALPSP